MTIVTCMGFIFFLVGIYCSFFYIRSKLKWDHPVMFCYYNLTLMGLGASTSQVVTQWAFIISSVLLIVTILRLPSKEVLKAIDNKSSQLEKKDKPVIILDVLVSKLKKCNKFKKNG